MADGAPVVRTSTAIEFPAPDSLKKETERHEKTHHHFTGLHSRVRRRRLRETRRRQNKSSAEIQAGRPAARQCRATFRFEDARSIHSSAARAKLKQHENSSHRQ